MQFLFVCLSYQVQFDNVLFSWMAGFSLQKNTYFICFSRITVEKVLKFFPIEQFDCIFFGFSWWTLIWLSVFYEYLRQLDFIWNQTQICCLDQSGHWKCGTWIALPFQKSFTHNIFDSVRFVHHADTFFLSTPCQFNTITNQRLAFWVINNSIAYICLHDDHPRIFHFTDELHGYDINIVSHLSAYKSIYWTWWHREHGKINSIMATREKLLGKNKSMPKMVEQCSRIWMSREMARYCGHTH